MTEGSLPETIGRYTIEVELGRGGMAVVYKGHDPSFDRDVAVKLLPQMFLHDPSFRGRFEREARTIAALDHPAIVPVYDFGEFEGEMYLVMRLMQGGTLQDRLEDRPMTLAEAADVFDRVAPALDEAHAQGMVHRDLKPGNILFDQRNDAYLADFGIVKLQGGSATFTGTGIIGTPAYMSPEQGRGEGEIDGRSDIYALGAILFEMLTGQAPYTATTPMAVVIKHLTDPVPRLLDRNPNLPSDSEFVISRAMAKDPEVRFQTAGEFAIALRAVADGKSLPTELMSKLSVPMRGSTVSMEEAVSDPSASASEAALAEEAGSRRKIPIWISGVGGSVLLLILVIIVVVRAMGGGAAVAEPTAITPSATEQIVIVASDTPEPTATATVTVTPTITNTSGPSNTPTETATATPTETNTPGSGSFAPSEITIVFQECRGLEGTIWFGQAPPRSLHSRSTVSYTVPPGTYALRVEWLDHGDFNADTTLDLQRDRVVRFGDDC